MPIKSSFNFLHNSRLNLNRSDWVCLSLLVILPVLWWWPLILGHLPDFMDTVMLQYPLRFAAAQQLHSGTLPLWMPNVMSGMPLMANPETGLWYWPNLLFFAFPSSVTYGLIIVFHFCLAGVSSFAYCRYFRCDPVAAFVAGITFQFGTFMVGHVALLPWVYAAAWLPLLLLAVEFDVRKSTSRILGYPTLFICLLFAQLLLIGTPQLVYYVAMVLPVYWMIRGIQKHSVAHIPKVLARGLIAASLAAGLASVQLLATYDLLSSTERSGALSQDTLVHTALNGGYLWRSLIGFTGPLLEDVDSVNAIGVGALVFLPLAFVRKKRLGLAILLFSIGVFGYLLSLGALVPVWSKLLPMFTSFHAPRRALFLWSLVGPLLLGFGVHFFLYWSKKNRLPKLVSVALIGLLLIPTLLMLPRMEREFVPSNHYDPMPEVAEALSGDGRFLTIDPTLNYSYGSREEDFGHSLIPNLAAWHGVQDIQGYNPLVLERYGIAREIASARSGVFYPSHGAFFTDPNSPVLRLMNVQYLIGRYDLFDPGRVIPSAAIDQEALKEKLTLAHEDAYWPLFKYKEVGPFAWLPKMSVAQETAEEALLNSVRIQNPFEVAFLDFESDEILYAPNATQFSTRLTVESAKQTSARSYEIQLSEPVDVEAQILVASISWHRGWAAFTPDGERLQSFPVNGFNTGVSIPKGVDRVTLKYAPRSFTMGLTISLGSLLLFLLLYFQIRKQKRVAIST